MPSNAETAMQLRRCWSTPASQDRGGGHRQQRTGLGFHLSVMMRFRPNNFLFAMRHAATPGTMLDDQGPRDRWLCVRSNTSQLPRSYVWLMSF